MSHLSFPVVSWAAKVCWIVQMILWQFSVKIILSDKHKEAILILVLTSPYWIQVSHGVWLQYGVKVKGCWNIIVRQFPSSTTIKNIWQHRDSAWKQPSIYLSFPVYQSELNMMSTSSCNTIGNGPLTRYAKLRVAHVPGMSGTFSPAPLVSDPDKHHGTCLTHVPWCMPGSLTSGFLWSRWRGKRSRHSQRMRTPQFCVSGKRPMPWSISTTTAVRRVQSKNGTPELFPWWTVRILKIRIYFKQYIQSIPLFYGLTLDARPNILYYRLRKY